jgi:tyrosyl-tRNA synthetase
MMDEISIKDVTLIGMDIADLYVRSDLCKTKSEARNFIKQGAVKINGHKIQDKFARIGILDDMYYVVEVIIDEIVITPVGKI